MDENLSYPIGKFDQNVEITPEIKQRFIEHIAELPLKLRAAVDRLNDEQLEAPYRPEGWTVRQTVHHVADSHQNSMIRFKLALTEDLPTIRPYFEDRWANLKDNSLPLDPSFKIIEGVHLRLTALLTSMTDEEFERKLIHPETGEWTLRQMLGLYAWHGRHHTAHIVNLRKRNNW